MTEEAQTPSLSREEATAMLKKALARLDQGTVLQVAAQHSGAPSDEVVQEAMERYCYSSSDNIEIDDTPFKSEADKGTWVSAWLWVPTSGADDQEFDDEPVEPIT